MSTIGFGVLGVILKGAIQYRQEPGGFTFAHL